MIESYQERRQLEVEPPRAAQFATVNAIDSGGITLTFAGEDRPSGRKWPYNTSVSFAVGQRVRVEKLSGGYVVAYPVAGGEPPVPPPGPGDEWQVVSVPEAQASWRLAYGNGVWVGVLNGRVIRSTDLLQWSEHAVSDLSGNPRLAHGNGVFVASCLDYFMVSTDGIAWTKVGLPFITTILAVFYINGYFWAGGTYKTILRSRDGITWTVISRGDYNDNSFILLSYGSEKYLALDGGETRYSSATGAADSWIAHPFPEWSFRSRSTAISYGGGNFVLKGANYADPPAYQILVSADGASWRTLPRTTFVSGSMAFAGARHWAVGEAILSSLDGETWTEQPLPGGVERLYDIHHANGKLVASGRNKIAYRNL